jgi:gamma-glutamylaminecyclotransferase
MLFVYGSLKEGFPNFHVNGGRRVPGRFRTVHPHPLYLADGVLPCLLPAAGQGHRVAGQLFEVGAAELARMDRLEKRRRGRGRQRVRARRPVAGLRLRPARIPARRDGPAHRADRGVHP